MAFAYPDIGQWYRRPDGTLLKVVAVDEESNTVEIQFFDGTIDEIEMDTWSEQFLAKVAAPEDWTGPVDMDPDDYREVPLDELPAGFHDPLEFLEEE